MHVMYVYTQLSTSPFWRRSTLGFLWRNDAKAETSVLWPPHAKSWLIGKDPDAGRDWGQEEKGTTEDEIVGWVTDSMEVSLSDLQELVMDREAWRAGIHGVAKSQTPLSDWTELNWRAIMLQARSSNTFSIYMTSLVAQMVKSLPAMQETRVQSLGREDPLEKEMAIHSSTIAWKIPWTRGAW